MDQGHAWDDKSVVALIEQLMERVRTASNDQERAAIVDELETKSSDSELMKQPKWAVFFHLSVLDLLAEMTPAVDPKRLAQLLYHIDRHAGETRKSSIE